MKIKSAYIATALVLAGGALLASCDDDKVYDMGHQEASLISEIHFDYEGEITLPVNQTVQLNPVALPEEAAATGFIYKTTNESVAYIDADGTLHCVGQGIANVSAVPAIGFGATASLTVNVVASVVYTESFTLAAEGGLPEFIYEGDTFKLLPVVDPADHTYSYYTWGTSNEEVLAVDQEGNVTCGKPGTATVYAETRFPDREGVRAELSMTVCEPVDVESLTIAPVTDAICVSRPFDLDVTYAPVYGTRGSVEWTSSNEEVAFVNRGHVTPTGFGFCTITATCKNGFTASVAITVTSGWYIWDSLNSFSPWYPASKVSFSYDDQGRLRVKMYEMTSGGNWRGDIVLVNNANSPLPFHFGEYPVVALRCTIPPNGRNTFDAASADGVSLGNPQCNEGKYATGNPITLADGTKLIYVDVKARNKYSTTELTPMKLFQLKVADIPAADVAADRTYTVYWIRTFRSVEEMTTFAEAEVANGK